MAEDAAESEEIKRRKSLAILLKVLSILLLLLGLVIIVVGCITFLYPFSQVFASAVLAVTGCLTFILGLLGFCFSYDLTFKKVSVVQILIMIVIVLDLSAGALVLNWDNNNTFREVARTLRDIRFRYSRNTENSDLTKRIDNIQKKHKCCGSTSPMNYVGSYWYQDLCGSSVGHLCGGQPLAPASCCTDLSPGMTHCPVQGDSTKAFEKGCANEVEKLRSKASKTVAWTAFITAFLLLLCWWLSYFISIEVQRRKRRQQDVKALTFIGPIFDIYPTSYSALTTPPSIMTVDT